MASMCSMISLIVLLLATYSSSAPLVPELQNATSIPQVENATGTFQFENLNVLVRREVAEERAVNDTVGLSSSSSEDEADKTFQTTEKLIPREMEDSSLSENNVEREIDAESLDTNENEREVDAEPLDANENERSFTDDTFTAEVNTKEGIQVQSFESSTIEQTSVAPPSKVKNVKRSSGSGSWLSADSDDAADRMKRDSGSGSWLSADSDDVADRMKRGSGSGSWLSDDSDDQVQKRSTEDDLSPAPADKRDADEEPSNSLADEPTNNKRTMEQPSSLSDEASEEFNRRAIGSVELNESSTIVATTIQFESTTEEQPFTSTEVIREKMSSTLESETTVTPVDHFTRPSPVPKEGKSKILAVIPGQISKSPLVINPATGKTAGFRPVHEIQLSQGQNQTITEEKMPNY